LEVYTRYWIGQRIKTIPVLKLRGTGLLSSSSKFEISGPDANSRIHGIPVRVRFHCFLISIWTGPNQSCCALMRSDIRAALQDFF